MTRQPKVKLYGKKFRARRYKGGCNCLDCRAQRRIIAKFSQPTTRTVQ